MSEHVAVANGWSLRRDEKFPLFPAILMVDENGYVRHVSTVSDIYLYKFLDAILTEHEE